MSRLLAIGGFLLLLGTIIFIAGGFAANLRARVTQAVGEASRGGEGWAYFAPWIGLALIVLGVIALAVVLIAFIRAALGPTINIGQVAKQDTSSPRPDQSRVPEEYREMVDTLSRILSIDYSTTVQWPRWIESMKDEALANKLERLTLEGLKHAGEIAHLVQELGGSPQWSFEVVGQGESDMKAVLTGQLEQQRLSGRLHGIASDLARDRNLRDRLKAMVTRKGEHIASLEEVLSAMGGSEMDMASQSATESTTPGPATSETAH